MQTLMKGEWRKAYETLSQLSSWKLVPKCEEVLAMLKAKLQEEGLRTYLFAYGAYYKSLSHAQLSAMFDLPEKKVRACRHRDLRLVCERPEKGASGSDAHTTAGRAAKPFSGRTAPQQGFSKCALQVHSVVSKMMIEETLSGSWDQPTATIVMHETQPTRLQDLAGQFAHKAGTLLDLNERALQLRTGGQRDADDEGGRFGEGSSFQGSRRCVSLSGVVSRRRVGPHLLVLVCCFIWSVTGTTLSRSQTGTV